MRNLELIENFTSNGKWTFTRDEVATRLDKDPTAVLRKLRNAGRIVSPARGFYAIVPEESRMRKVLPPLRYVDQLMKFHRVPYYVALLSAADRYGVAPQAPQALQVMTYPPRRPLPLLRSETIYYSRKNISQIPVTVQNTPTGTIRVATPEATFFDLVEFQQRVGGLEYIAELVAELSEQFKKRSFRLTMQHYGTRVLQRAGYLLELVQLSDIAEMVKQQLGSRRPLFIPLNPALSNVASTKSSSWKLYLNDQLEPDI